MLRIYGVARTRAFRVLWIAKGARSRLRAHPDGDRSRSARANRNISQSIPNGGLPAIEDDDFVLWESLAITLYLAKKHLSASIRRPSMGRPGHGGGYSGRCRKWSGA